MGNQFSPWSDMELTQLKELAGQFSAAHISAQIGRSTEGVRKMTKKLGLKSFVSTPPKPRPAARRTPVERQDTPKPFLSPTKPVTVRKASVQNNVSYPPLEYCHVHHVLVSNWSDHISRQGGTCERPAA